MSPSGRHQAQRSIQADALKTMLLTSGVFALSAAVSYLLLGGLGVVFGALAVLLSAWVRGRGELMMRLLRAQPLGYYNAPRLVLFAESLARAAGLPSPALYWLPSPLPNALALETSDGRGGLAVTAGLLQKLTPREVEAVLAHEISHLKHGDTRRTRWTTAVSDSAMLLLRVSVWVGFVGALLSDNGLGLWVVLVIGSWVLPVVFGLLHSAISRSREFAADAAASVLTGNPMALASALGKLDERRLSWFGALLGRPTAPGWLDTHPATAERVRRLLELRGGGPWGGPVRRHIAHVPLG